MQDVSAELLQRVIALRPDWDAADLSGFIYLEGGYSNHNYRFTYAGERYVLRAPFRSRFGVDRHLERRVYEHASAHVTPELLALDPVSGDMISRWVPGTLLADSTVSLGALAGYLADLHGRLPAVERDYHPVAHARAHLAEADAPAWVHRLAADMAWRPEQTATCHNDLNPWNVIRTSERHWVTLDWEWVGRNDPLFDLVTLHQGAALDESALHDMARRYLGTVPPRERLQRCLTAFWLRETTWAMAELSAGNDRPEVVAQRTLGLERLSRCVSEFQSDG